MRSMLLTGVLFCAGALFVIVAGVVPTSIDWTPPVEAGASGLAVLAIATVLRRTVGPVADPRTPASSSGPLVARELPVSTK